MKGGSPNRTRQGANLLNDVSTTSRSVKKKKKFIKRKKQNPTNSTQEDLNLQLPKFTPSVMTNSAST